MKKVVAVIKPFKLEDAKEALTAINIPGMTVEEVMGFGRQKGHTEIYRGAEYSSDLVPKLEVECVVADEAVETVTEAILTSCKTGNIGDGKIFVCDLEEVVRVRTGEKGQVAL